MRFTIVDVKNHIEDLQTNHKNVLKFPLIHCIVPVEKHRFKGFEFEKIMNEDHIQFEPKISKKKYIETIRKIKNHIQNGDFYEAHQMYRTLHFRLVCYAIFDLLSVNSSNVLYYRSMF